MIPGIEILNTLPVYGLGKWWIGLIIGGLLITATIVIAIIEDKVEYSVVVLFAVIVTELMCFAFNSIGREQIGERYQVTIDDSVSMIEFTERYNIIKQEGKIYTIEEKEKQ